MFASQPSTFPWTMVGDAAGIINIYDVLIIQKASFSLWNNAPAHTPGPEPSREAAGRLAFSLCFPCFFSYFRKITFALPTCLSFESLVVLIGAVQTCSPSCSCVIKGLEPRAAKGALVWWCNSLCIIFAFIK